jgi:hypothetical protein
MHNMSVVVWMMVLIPMSMLLIAQATEGMNISMYMINMSKRMYFAWRHSIRSNKYNIMSAYHMATQVYPTVHSM